MKRRFLRPMFWFLLLCISVVCAVFASDGYIRYRTTKKTFSSTESIPTNKVGLLLGTAKYSAGGRINRYYKNRLDAVYELYKAGKIKYILISGDNGSMNYDEPTAMQKDLMEMGIPKEVIYLDYAGFRTLDSVVRAKHIFGQESITVISQKFHNERAIFLANRNGLQAVGYNAKDVNIRYGYKIQIREKLARFKVFIDLLFNVQPKFLGEKIDIPTDKQTS